MGTLSDIGEKMNAKIDKAKGNMKEGVGRFQENTGIKGGTTTRIEGTWDKMKGSVKDAWADTRLTTREESYDN